MSLTPCFDSSVSTPFHISSLPSPPNTPLLPPPVIGSYEYSSLSKASTIISIDSRDATLFALVLLRWPELSPQQIAFSLSTSANRAPLSKLAVAQQGEGCCRLNRVLLGAGTDSFDDEVGDIVANSHDFLGDMDELETVSFVKPHI